MKEEEKKLAVNEEEQPAANEEKKFTEDGPGFEAVTVVIMSDDADHARLMELSVASMLRGVTGHVLKIIDTDGRQSQVEQLQAHLDEVPTERIVLMTDGMLLLQPVTLYDIGVRKAFPASRRPLRTSCTPVLMHLSVLREMLEYLACEFPHEDVADYYQKNTLWDVAPVMYGASWRDCPWLLPVVSQLDDVSVLKHEALTHKFLLLQPQAWTPAVVQFLEKRFAVK